MRVAHQRVISPLLARARARGIDPAAVSRRISIFAEKGAVTSFWDDAADRWSHQIDPATVVPASLRDEITGLLRDDPEFRNYIFFDGDKETMVSVEMRHETPEPAPAPVTPGVFRPVAERFAAEVRRLAGERGYDDIEVDCTTIAVDIQRLGVGKDLGTRLAFDWLRSTGQAGRASALLRRFGIRCGHGGGSVCADEPMVCRRGRTGGLRQRGGGSCH